MTQGTAAGLLPAYLIVGSDELKRADMLKRLRSHVSQDFIDFNLDEFEGKAVDDPETLRSSLETMPFGADFRLVIVHGVESLAKPVSEMLVAYLANPNPSCVVCLVAEKLAKNTRLYKAVAKVGPKSVVDCAPMKRWQLPQHVMKIAPGHGVSIAADAAEELVNRCGESTKMLDNQLGTLAELISPRTSIELADVMENVAQTAEVSPWTFLDVVSERNAARALELYNLMENPSEVFLHSILVGRLRELICAQSLSARGAAGQLASELGRAPWQVKNHVRWAGRFRPGELVGLLSCAAACERALKGSADTQTAFIEFVLAICSGV